MADIDIAQYGNVERYEDEFLGHDDVQLLSSSDGVALFFSKLRYNVAHTRIQQTFASMGIRSDNLRASIKSIEQIASHEDFDKFTVYLFEVRSLTVAIRSELAQQFRD